MEPLLLFLALLLAILSVHSQTRLTGQVGDEQGKPLAFANVLLVNARDSSLVKGAVASDGGVFLLENLRPGRYKVAASAVGFRKTYSPVFELNSTDGTHSMAPMMAVAEAKKLDEVQVSAQKPLFEQQMDRLVINVQSSITSAGSTVLDVLERSPGVTVDRQNNTLAMNGKQGVMVMLNGKLTRIPMSSVMQLLGGMNAGNLEKVELITTPPAQYDAEGNAGLINIVTKRNPNLGTNGSWSANFGMGKWERAGAAFNVNRRTEKLSLFADYSGQMNHFLRVSGGGRTLTRPVPLQTILTGRRNQRDWVHNGQFGLETNLSGKTMLGVLATLQNLQSNQVAFNTALTMRQELPVTLVNVRDDELNDTRIYTGNVNLRHKLNPKQELSADVDHIRFVNNDPHCYQFDYEYPQESRQVTELVRNEKRTPIRLWVAKADYSHTISKTVKLEMGAKATFAHFDNNILFEGQRDGIWVIDSQLSQNVRMNEDIWAGYVNLSGQMNPKSRFQAGLRYEHTETDLRDMGGRPQVYRNYGNWFPTVFFARDLSKSRSWQMAYSRRISRPGFGQLASAYTFIDPNYYLRGNERLLPALSHNVQTTLRFSKNWLLTLDYTRFKNAITYNLEVIPGQNSQFTGPVNLDRSDNLALTFSFPLPVTKWWQMQTNVQAVRQTARLTLEGSLTQQQQLTYGRLISTQTFRLPRRFTAELSGFYQSRSLLGVMKRRPFGALNLGLQKQLSNNRGMLRLSGEDILWTNLSLVDIANSAEGYTVLYDHRAHNRLIRLTYSRPFGNQKVSVNSKRTTGSDDEWRRMN